MLFECCSGLFYFRLRTTQVFEPFLLYPSVKRTNAGVRPGRRRREWINGVQWEWRRFGTGKLISVWKISCNSQIIDFHFTSRAWQQRASTWRRGREQDGKYDWWLYHFIQWGSSSYEAQAWGKSHRMSVKSWNHATPQSPHLLLSAPWSSAQAIMAWLSLIHCQSPATHLSLSWHGLAWIGVETFNVHMDGLLMRWVEVDDTIALQRLVSSHVKPSIKPA